MWIYKRRGNTLRNKKKNKAKNKEIEQFQEQFKEYMDNDDDRDYIIWSLAQIRKEIIDRGKRFYSSENPISPEQVQEWLNEGTEQLKETLEFRKQRRIADQAKNDAVYNQDKGIQL
jgi:hypothetical protein